MKYSISSFDSLSSKARSLFLSKKFEYSFYVKSFCQIILNYYSNCLYILFRQHQLNHLLFFCQFFQDFNQKKKLLKEYDQDILNKTLQKLEYDPLNTKQIRSKETLLVTNKITIVKQKIQTSDSKGNFAAKPNMAFADSFRTMEPIQEKKVKIQKNTDDDDEIDIRIIDGIQRAALIRVYCSKQITLFDNKVKIPIVLLVQSLPQYRILCEKIDITKLHNAQETIQFLSSNQERKIIFDQVILKLCEYTQHLKELSEKLIKQKNKIVAQKFDKDNASFLILHQNQLEQILKARKQSFAFDA
ncbi:unnamed protein product [Paramecium primaurelia]|uniref:Uncharacterized protein n=1 Tax=Paramecium primaurelia TaxID=5886 RepID=A0A8S1NHX9_PARPR|nr:unnamed protein product [Paramecium primaurelia]